MIDVHVLNGNPMLFIAFIAGKEVGRMQVTIIPLVHDMEIDPNVLALPIADALHDAACQKVSEAGFSEALILVANENLPMRRYVERLNASEEPPSSAFLMDPAG